MLWRYPQGPGSACEGMEACVSLIWGDCMMADGACCGNVYYWGDDDGVPQGPGTECGPVAGCCHADASGNCYTVHSQTCHAMGGSSLIYHFGNECRGDLDNDGIDDACEWWPPCFLAGTQISMADGSYESIENVQVGDLVKSYDLDKKREIVGVVTETLHHEPHEMGPYYVVINGSLGLRPA